MTTPLSRAVLWDLDGPLVDSAELHWLSWRDTMEAEGPISYQEFLDSFGQKNGRILPGWLAEDARPERFQRVGSDHWPNAEGTRSNSRATAVTLCLRRALSERLAA